MCGFYKLVFDMDGLDASIAEGKNPIYAEATNMNEIVHADVKKGFFDNYIYAPRSIRDWPEVEFYYSSKASARESDYLMNIKRWPLIHRRVMEAFMEAGIEGLQYFPVRLIDVVTQECNSNYVVMYIENFIDAYDMERSKYRYNEKYDFYTFMPMETYLNQSVCAAYDIFRCSKNPPPIYVSEKIKALAEVQGWTGFGFYRMK